MADCCYAECCYAECHAECRFAECRYAECHFKSLYPECRYAECCYAECRYAECRYAECRYAECRGTLIYVKKSFIRLVLGLPNFQSNQQSNIFLLEKLFIKILNNSRHKELSQAKDIFEILSKCNSE